MDKATIIQMITDAYNAAGLNPAVGVAQAEFESSFNPNVTAADGGQGLFQFMPGTWATWGQGSPYDPAAAIAANVKFMSWLLKQFNGRYDIALAGYNSGPNRQEYRNAAAQNRPINWANTPPATQAVTPGYVKRILDKAGIPVTFRMPASIKR